MAYYSNYLATQNRPNYARKVFPCFDEPAFKVPYTVSIARPENYTTLFISPVESTEPMYECYLKTKLRNTFAKLYCIWCCLFFFRLNKTNYVIDHFKRTEPLSTFAFGFIISQLARVNGTPTALTKPKINVWARKDLHGDLTVRNTNRLCTITVPTCFISCN